MLEGRIIKSLSGFYTVKAAEGNFTCKGRGVFRNRNITPCVGDDVLFEKLDDKTGYIKEVKPRDNEFIRPQIANMTQALVVHSAVQPTFNPLLLDRFLVMVESKRIKPMILISKKDLATDEEREKVTSFKRDYEQIGYDVLFVTLDDEEDLKHIEQFFAGERTVITGQSGVGKSTLLNCLKSSLNLATGDVSHTLGRGRHTTRHVELIEINGGLVADTPGFSSIEFADIEAEELGRCFIEIKRYANSCKFRGCLHHREPQCAVKEAVERGDILSYRYDNYLKILHEIISRKPRY